MPRRNKYPLQQRMIEKQQLRLKQALSGILKVKDYEVDEHSYDSVLSFQKGFDKPKHVAITPHGRYRYKGQEFNFVGIVNRLGLLAT